MSFKDHFSTQSREYTLYRPRYPRALFAFLASIAPARDRVWDCGTGNGQAATALAEFFDEVVATDPSGSQLANATADAKVSYVRAAAEHCPLADGSVDLVTVAQAVHWFDLLRFYAEVRRVGRAGSVLALWSYGLARVSPEVDAAVHVLYADILGKYWPPERGVIEQGYATIDFPFAAVRAPSIEMTDEWTLERLLGYLGTWSSTQAYIRRHGQDPVLQVRDRLAAAWGPRDSVRQLQWDLDLRVGHIA